MEQYIPAFLFQTGSCPLGVAGCLYMSRETAVPDFGNKSIAAPLQQINWSADAKDATAFVEYVASVSGQSGNDIKAGWEEYCSALKAGISAGNTAIPGIGHFGQGTNGDTVLFPEKLPAAYYPPVSANRVIHPEAEHSMIVGDRETTNTQMAEYLREEPVRKDRWWIWALVIAAIALALVVIYITDTAGNNSLGNAASFDFFN